MPQVPRYDTQRIEDQSLPNVRIQDNSNPEMFGIGTSQQRLNQATNNVFDTLLKIGQEEKKSADQMAVMSADRQASELQTKIQVGVKGMQGKDAFGADDYYRKNWNSGISNIRNSLANDDQKEAFDRHAMSRDMELNKSVQYHMFEQQKAFDNSETDSFINTSRQNAVLNAHDDVSVNSELQKQSDALKQWGARNGFTGSKSLDAKIQADQSKTIKDVIQERLNIGNINSAQDFFDKNKTKMGPEDIPHVEKMIDDQNTIDKGNAVWDKVKDYKLSDGTPDEGKMRDAVMSIDGISAKKKEDIFKFIKARSSEEIVNQNRQDQATDLAFMNSMTTLRKTGAPVDYALSQVKNYSKNPYDQSIKEDAVRKIYAPPSESDPSTFINMWQKIQDGHGNQQEIDTASANNKLNVSDWRKLREDLYKSNIEGKNPETKSTWERIKVLAEDKFGSDKVGKDSYLYDLHVTGKDKSPEELWKMANDKFQGDPNTGLWGFWQTKQWKSEIQKLDAQNLAWGKAHEDIGRNETSAIGQGVLFSGKKTYGLGDIDAFAAQFGGYDKIKSGTPVNNAIQSLMSHKQIVTPSNVKAVLQKYPDGKY